MLPNRDREGVGAFSARTLFVSERHHRIHMRGAARRKIAGQYRDSGQQQRHRGKGNWISGPHSPQELFQHPCHCESTRDAQGNTDRRQQHALPHHQRQHIWGARAQRHP